MSDCLLFDEFQIQAMGMGSPDAAHRTVTAGMNPAQSIVTAVQPKKIYCKPAAYQ